MANQLKQWHLKVIEIVKRGQHRKSLDKLFQGFKPAVESCYFNWEVAYPLESITYSSTEKKSANFCWPRAAQLHRGVKTTASAGGELFESVGGSRVEGADGGDYKERGGHLSQQEMAVRPKETILTKRKGLSLSGGGGMLVRLGGNVSLPLEDSGGKCMYKGPSSSGGKLKLAQGGGKGTSTAAVGGTGALGGGKHTCSKRRTSSEDSSLEPDLAELSLDDGCSLALGAEASNTFEFLPPPSEILPPPTPLLEDSPKCNDSNAVSKGFEASQVGSSSSQPPSRFIPKESAATAVDELSSPAKEAERELELIHHREENVGLVGSHQPSTFIAKASPGTTQTLSAPPRGQKEAAPAERTANQGVDDGAVEQEAVAEDDYQAYFLSTASEEGAERQLVDSHQEEEPDIFAGIKPLEQEGQMEVRKGMRHL